MTPAQALERWDYIERNRGLLSPEDFERFRELAEQERSRLAANAAPPPLAEGPRPSTCVFRRDSAETTEPEAVERGDVPNIEAAQAAGISVDYRLLDGNRDVDIEAANGPTKAPDASPAPPNQKPRRKRSKNRGGRPLGWSPEVAFRLGLALGRGRSWTDVAKAAGVGKSTLYRWYRLGESGDARFVPLATALKAARESDAFWSVNRRSYGSIFRTAETPDFGTEGPAECVGRMRENDGDAPETDALGRGML
ncbi:MAG: hypothetical protein ACLQVF_20545 [Isosphaeraceae bacterium]